MCGKRGVMRNKNKTVTLVNKRQKIIGHNTELKKRNKQVNEPQQLQLVVIPELHAAPHCPSSPALLHTETE
jgi:hypothetical protein